METFFVPSNRWNCRVAAVVAVLAAVCAVANSAGRLSADETPAKDIGSQFSQEQVDFFENDVLPILKANCFECHGGQAKIKGSLRLTSREAFLKGGDTGPAVSLDKPDESLLLEAINFKSLEMPPKGKLPAKEIETLTRWVTLGMPWKPGAVAIVEEEPKHGPPQVNDENRKFWSFQPVQQPSQPEVANKGWVHSPVDAFILARLEQENLSPAPPASKTSLIRRAYYDLTGLPPEPADVEAFLADESPEAFEKVIDRLLESPHYGEQWGRHWLDLVRYAETNSYERDDAKPFVWKYRDYVIQSFNSDKPYDQFVREQLAGDELDSVTPESIIATGYYRLGIWDDEPTDHELAFYDDIDDVISTTGQVFLGLTLGCARCHDHKLDPIPQADYYRMLAFFRNVRRFGVRAPDTVTDASVRVIASADEQKRFEESSAIHQTKLKQTEEQLAAIENSVREKLVGGEKDDFKDESSRPRVLQKHVPQDLPQDKFDEYTRLVHERDELRKNPPPGLERALCVKESGNQPLLTNVLIRGNHQAKGAEVQPGPPSILDNLSPALASIQSRPESTGRRRALADWVANAQNPLTARVIVNRIWQFHFGRGIVRSSNNFGLQGDAPTHPELLDWLAADFVNGGWKFKRLHKLIMLSSAYQMSAAPTTEARNKDPQNNLFHSFDMRRLTAEEVRDSILAANGSLNRDKLYGPSVYPVIPQEVLHGQSQPGYGWGKSSTEDQARRSVYIHVKRSLLVPILESFDLADPDSSCPVRFVTTQPTQALGMLNSEFLGEQSRVFAEYLKRTAGSDDSARVALALRRTLQRTPREAEVARGVEFIASLQKQHSLSADAALEQFCLLALNLNEFLFLD